MVDRWRGAYGALMVFAVAWSGGCGEFFANQTASLGGNTAGGRGTVRVLFINNTAHSAVFTYGSYDQSDPGFAPDFAQFSLEAFDVRSVELGPGATSSIASTNARAFLDCARVFGIGSADLLDLIRKNRSDASVFDEAMVSGVEFFDAAGGEVDAEAEAEPASVGSAPPFEALLGVDFPCNALLVLRFELDDTGPEPFRVDFELFPSESDR